MKLTDGDIKRGLELCERATPGPWEWFGNTKMAEVYLATTHSGRVFVMDFARWGMSLAQPRFQVRYEGGLGCMRKLSELEGDNAPKMVASHRKEFVGIGHPDAALIASARALLPAALEDVRQLRDALIRAQTALYDAMHVGHLSRAYHDSVAAVIDAALASESK